MNLEQDSKPIFALFTLPNRTRISYFLLWSISQTNLWMHLTWNQWISDQIFAWNMKPAPLPLQKWETEKRNECQFREMSSGSDFRVIRWETEEREPPSWRERDICNLCPCPHSCLRILMWFWCLGTEGWVSRDSKTRTTMFRPTLGVQGT